MPLLQFFNFRIGNLPVYGFNKQAENWLCHECSPPCQEEVARSVGVVVLAGISIG